MVSGLTNYGNGVMAVQTPRSAMFVLRTLGSALLGLSLIIALLLDGPSFGSLLWATAISLAVLAVALILPDSSFHYEFILTFIEIQIHN